MASELATPSSTAAAPLDANLFSASFDVELAADGERSVLALVANPLTECA